MVLGTAYLSSHVEQEVALDILQEDLNIIKDWCAEKDIGMNANKFILIIFSIRVINGNLFFTFGLDIIPISDLA